MELVEPGTYTTATSRLPEVMEAGAATVTVGVVDDAADPET
jgi:hypothetical protein